MPETKKVDLKKTKEERISMGEFLNPTKKEQRVLSPFEEYVVKLCSGEEKL